MTTAIRTPDQITDAEVQRAAWEARAEHVPVDHAIGSLSPLRLNDFLRDDIDPDSPERQAWQHGSRERDWLSQRITAALEAYRTYTTPVVLTSRVGQILISTLAHLCWAAGIPSWGQVEALIDGHQQVRELAEALGYPGTVTLAEIVPAVDTAWGEIAAAAGA